MNNLFLETECGAHARIQSALFKMTGRSGNKQSRHFETLSPLGLTRELAEVLSYTGSQLKNRTNYE